MTIIIYNHNNVYMCRKIPLESLQKKIRKNLPKKQLLPIQKFSTEKSEV